MTTLAPRNKYAILMKYRTKEQKQRAIDELIDLILKEYLNPDELQDAKQDAQLLAESLLRCQKKQTTDSREA